MYAMMNKVRKLPDKTVYEVVEYDDAKPLNFVVRTVDCAGLQQYFDGRGCDFDVSRGYLRSRAETVTTRLFERDVVEISVEGSIFSLLLELVRKDAYFIPASLFSEGREYTLEDVASFPNIRVSNSTMFVGFSLRHDGGWASSKILYCEGGELKQKAFYFALPENESPESLDVMPICGTVVNGRACRVYSYDCTLSVTGSMTPVLYVPSPLLNHLNLKYSGCVNASNFLDEIFDEKGILLSEPKASYGAGDQTGAVRVKASPGNTAGERRRDLIDRFDLFGGELGEFVEEYGLNPLERYALSRVRAARGQVTPEGVYGIRKGERIGRSLNALPLMAFRCQVFGTPQCFFPPGFVKLYAYGGGGGDWFTTAVTVNKR